MVPKKFLTTADILDQYGVDEATVQSLVDAGQLKALADRGTWKYRRDDLEALIAGGKLHAVKDLPTVDDIEFAEGTGFEDFGSGDDRVDFIELDEDALSGHSTVISGSLPPDLDKLQLSFNEEPGSSADISTSDVELVSDKGFSSESDVVIADDNLSDFEPNVVDAESRETDVPADEVDSELNIDEIDDRRIGSDIDIELLDGPELEDAAPVDGPVNEMQATTTEGIDPYTVSATEADADTLDEEPHAVQEHDTLPDFAVNEHASALADQDEGLAFDIGDSGLTLEVSDSDFPGRDRSDLLESADSGLSLDSADSGLTLDAADSGLTLDTGDSGLTLDAGDSGLTLDVADSGLSLQVPDDETAPRPTAEATQRMAQFTNLDLDDDELDFDSGSGDSGGTQRLAVEERFAEERAFIDEEPADPTAIFMVDEDADSDYIGTLSGAIAAGEEVEELDVAPALEDEIFEEDLSDDIEALDEEIVDADDSAFSDATLDSEEGEESFITPTKAVAPREPSWGAFTAAMVMAATVLVCANAWLMWEGMSTMWNGSEPSGPASTLISTVGGMFG